VIASRAPRPQPPVELRASKSKKEKANESKNAFICFHLFLESGFFKGLQAKK
jgi:hypothetical protein